MDEIKWDQEEDEDALILAEQPFETAMQAGHSDFLNHLPTKFIARRSDIIISSTLSFTLTPIEYNSTPTHFALVTLDEKDDYVMQRNVFRALNVTSNELPIPKKIRGSNVTDWINSSLSVDERSGSDEGSDPFELNESDISHASSPSGSAVPSHFTSEMRVRLPETLLNELLPPNMVARLRLRDKKMYNMQKSRYEVIQKMVAK